MTAKPFIALITVLAVGAGFMTNAGADPIADFYKGKRVKVILPSSPGGSYDRYARVLSAHMGRHIAGNPKMYVQNMPGAGGKRGANHLYVRAAQDGSVIGAVHSFISFDPLFEGPKSKAIFDPRKFNWIGAITNSTALAISWHTSKVKTYKDLYKHELVVGGVGTSTPMVTNAHVFRQMFGMKFKVIAGYLGSGEVDLAMERGEVFGKADVSWVSLKQRSMGDIKKGKIRLLYQMALQKNQELKDVPLALDFARNAEERKILETVFLSYEFGRPYLAPPNVPADRMAALRKAFMDTLKDPKFLKHAKKSRVVVNPVKPERLISLLHKAYATPASLIARIKSLKQPPGKLEKVRFKTVRAKLLKIKKKGRRVKLSVMILGGGKETVKTRGRRTKILINHKKAKVKALKPGMTCAIAYLGNNTTAQKIDCD